MKTKVKHKKNVKCEIGKVKNEIYVKEGAIYTKIK